MTQPPPDTLETMLENLTIEQKAVIDKIVAERNISPKEALKEKLAQEQEDDRESRRESHAP